MKFNRKFTVAGQDVFGEVSWVAKDVRLEDKDGNVLFEQKKVLVPDFWSQTAADILASKYFRKTGVPDTGGEVSARQPISRIVEAVSESGETQGYFDTPNDKFIFQDELTHILLHQMGAFNSPVWFNVGLFEAYGIEGESSGNYVWSEESDCVIPTENAYEHPQVSACYIQPVNDDLMDIADHVKREMRLFKMGSGTGTNFSSLRGKGEPLSGGGTSSGVISFLKILDSAAGATKSGGGTRRAATLRVLNVDHPDIVEFVEWKAKEELKAEALIAAGYDPDFNGEAYATVSGQNSNNSVMVSSEFMERVVDNTVCNLWSRTSGDAWGIIQAKDLWEKICQSAWQCGDPGIIFEDAVNRWNPVPKSGRICAANPCVEFFATDNSACNLFCLNLKAFLGEAGFRVKDFRHVVEIAITAQDILVDYASYPTKEIAENSHKMRQLGLGYANLGGLLMSLGIPYDSDEGRNLCSSITSLMTAAAWNKSAEMSAERGRCAGYEDTIYDVIHKHHNQDFAYYGYGPGESKRIAAKALDLFRAAMQTCDTHGTRNSTVTLLQPGGTCGLLMDCDTLCLEPDFALVKHKKLAGGGSMKIVNQSIRDGLEALGYDWYKIDRISDAMERGVPLEEIIALKPEHKPVFACANEISPLGHLKMVAAAQPLLSMGISKTVNVPNETTPEQIGDIYMKAWEMGLKAVSVYRDGCKSSQPLSDARGGEKRKSIPTYLEEKKSSEDVSESAREVLSTPGGSGRKRPSREGKALRKKFQCGQISGHIHVDLYEDSGQPGAVFIVVSKDGSTIGGLCNALAVQISLSLQYGVPLQEIVGKLKHTKFEPAGLTGDEIHFATSIPDYLGKFLEEKFLTEEDPCGTIEISGEICTNCGQQMQRAGTCYQCSCGNSSGGCG